MNYRFRILSRCTALVLVLSVISSLLLPVAVNAVEETGEEGLTFALCDAGSCVTLHTDLQSAYLADDPLQIAAYASGIEELSRPLPVRLTWTVSGGTPETYTVAVSESADMTDAWIFTAGEPALDLYNAKIGTTYYWTVSAERAGVTYTSAPASFTTDGTFPRNLYVDSVTNVRDLGGRVTVDGGSLRQGLIYRGGQLNGSAVLSQESKDVLLDQLGIRTEIDLRTDTQAKQIKQSPLGAQVKYVRLPMSSSGTTVTNNILANNPDAIAEVFVLLSDPDNYPVYFTAPSAPTVPALSHTCSAGCSA